MSCSPATSSNEIYIDEMMEDCLTDWIEQTETELDGKAETNHTHEVYAEIDHVHEDYAEVNHEHTGYAEANHEHTGYANAEHSHSGYAPTNHAHTGYAETEHTHTAEDVGAATVTHAHITAENGSFKYSYRQTDNVNLLDALKALPVGFHTVYSQSGVTGNPKTTEAWRFMVHKTGETVIWVQGYGSLGSVYTHYCADGVWVDDWKCIYDANPAPLWTGEMYMSTNQEVTPSKPLSKCAHGWLLLWGDYNPSEGVQNVDFATTIISKKAYSGQNWNGGQWLCVVPRFADSGGEASVVKTLQVFDNKLVGNALNSVSPRNDVVLRAVYEF